MPKLPLAIVPLFVLVGFSAGISFFSQRNYESVSDSVTHKVSISPGPTPSAMGLSSFVQEEVEPVEVGQMLLISPSGPSLTEKEKYWLSQGKVAGVFLLSRNVKSQVQLEELIAEIQATATPSGIIPLIAVDQEGGRVSRIPWINKISQQDIQTPEKAFGVAFERGQQLKTLGIDMNFAPVIEAVATPSAFIAKEQRSFKTNDSELGQAMIAGYLQAGIIPVVKHFPGGLGSTALDPHKTMPQLEIDQAEFELELLPFYEASEWGIPALMATHLVYPLVDTQPVTRSSVFLTDILRNKLDYHGVVVIDDLSMGAVMANYDVGEYAVASIEAGADLLLVSEERHYRQVYQALTSDFISDEEFRSKVQLAAETVRRLKLF